jgi:V/A-type H+-transporting ATPase subunit B
MMTKRDTLLAQADRKLLSGREYRGASRIDGPLVYMRNTHPVGYGELVEVTSKDGKRRAGQVLDTSDDVVVVQVFEGRMVLICRTPACGSWENPLPSGSLTRCWDAS